MSTRLKKIRNAIAFLIFLVAEMRSVLHDRRRWEWAWSETAAGGGKRERDKGENKEYMFRFAQLQVLSANVVGSRYAYAPEATIFSSGTFKCRLPKGTYAWCYLLFALIRYLNATGNKDQGYYRLYRLLLPALKIGLRVRRRDHFFGVQHRFFW